MEYSSGAGYSVNDFVATKVPIFWAGNAKVDMGVAPHYERNVFHTRRLFALDADLRRLFRDDMVEQGRNLTAMLSVASANISRPEKISVALRQLGKRHAAYGVRPEHFALVEDALLFALEHALIDVFTAEVKAAWQAAYALLTSMMLEEITPRFAVPRS